MFFFIESTTEEQSLEQSSHVHNVCDHAHSSNVTLKAVGLIPPSGGVVGVVINSAIQMI